MNIITKYEDKVSQNASLMRLGIPWYCIKLNTYDMDILEVLARNEEKEWMSCDSIMDIINSLNIDEIKNKLDNLYKNGYVIRKFENNDFKYMITKHVAMLMRLFDDREQEELKLKHAGRLHSGRLHI